MPDTYKRRGRNGTEADGADQSGDGEAGPSSALATGAESGGSTAPAPRKINGPEAPPPAAQASKQAGNEGDSGGSDSEEEVPLAKVRVKQVRQKKHLVDEDGHLRVWQSLNDN